jgi:hypothetical protein
MANIYEQPWLLLITSAVVLLVIVVYRGLKPQSRKWWQWMPVVILVVAAFGIDYLVKTDVEKVKVVIARAVKAAEKEDVEAIGQLISDDYHDSFNDSKQDLLRRLRARLSESIIEKNVPGILTLKVIPPNANVVFTVRVVFDPRGPVYDFRKQMILKFEAGLVKQGDDWFIQRVEVLELDMQPIDWQRIYSGAGEMLD